jgi:hypothetical protein
MALKLFISFGQPVTDQNSFLPIIEGYAVNPIPGDVLIYILSALLILQI